ncbi:MAG: WG repeat-containing protein [Bacteroidota bacterium]
MMRTLLRPILFLFAVAGTIEAFSQKLPEYLLPYSDSSSGTELLGFRSPAGKNTIPARYTATTTDTMFRIAFVLNTDEWVVINRMDTVILTPFIYDNGPDYVQEGYFRFVENDKMGFADLRGDKIIKAEFEWVEPFRGGLAAFNTDGHFEESGEHRIRKGGTWGFIDRRGRKVIPAKYTQVYEFRGKYCEAWTEDGEHVLLDKKGKVAQTLKK